MTDKMLRVIKLVNGETIFGECETVYTENAAEVLIKTPFCAKPAGIMPYMADIMASAPGAIQIHPMNILWTVPLDEFPQVLEKYKAATSVLVQPKSGIIL